MTVSRSYARALGASLCWGIGSAEFARRVPIAEATAEAIRLANLHRCPAWVYRLPRGDFVASTCEPEMMPGAEVAGRHEFSGGKSDGLLA